MIVLIKFDFYWLIAPLTGTFIGLFLGRSASVYVVHHSLLHALFLPQLIEKLG